MDPPLVKDKFGVYQTPLDPQATIQNASPFLSEAQVRDMRYEMGIGKSGALDYTQVGGTSTSPPYDFSSIDGLFSSWTLVNRTYLTESGILNDPIDFVSTHSYANYSSQLSNLRSNVTGHPNLPLLITEYNSFTTFGDNAPCSLHQAAAAFFNDVSGLITNTDNPKVYWAQWIDDDAGGGLGMLTETLHRKAIYDALKIYQTMLPADQVSVSPASSSGVGSMAAMDPEECPWAIGAHQILMTRSTNASYSRL